MTKPITECTDAELAAELLRREKVRAAEARAARLEKIRKIIAAKEALLTLIPHGRTSCDDENVHNGFGSADYGARCNRCALIELDEWNAEDYDVQIEFTVRKV